MGCKSYTVLMFRIQSCFNLKQNRSTFNFRGDLTFLRFGVGIHVGLMPQILGLRLFHTHEKFLGSQENVLALATRQHFFQALKLHAHHKK